MSSAEAAARLGVKRETLYSYVSRGLIRSEPGEGRRRRFRRDDVERVALQGRKADRQAGTSLVMESSVSVVEHGRLLYRGVDAAELAATQPFESVAGLLWDDVDGEADWDAPASWGAPAAALAAQSSWPADALPRERLMLAATTLSIAHGQQMERTRAAVLQHAGPFVSALVDALDAGPGRVRSGPAAAEADTDAEAAIAARVAEALCGRTPPAALVHLVNSALILVADHGLATPTLTARLVASVGADMYTAVLAGCCAMHGSAPGASALAVEQLLRDAARGDPRRVVAERLERGEPLPGVGHPVYPERDPRAAHLLAELRHRYPDQTAMQTVTDVEHAMAAAGQPAPNVDFALAALCYVTRLRPGASEAIFTLGRIAGFIAHCIEQYASNERYRLNAVYVGPGPAPPPMATNA
ncbi:MAG TPA: citrate/2-methylcitrate synthase [Acidimicrobiales bacterium]